MNKPTLWDDVQEQVEALYAPPARELARTTDPETSHEAARMLGGKAGTMRRRLLTVFLQGSRTAEEAADAAGYTAADGAWKRVSDLAKASLIVDIGITRPGRSGREQRVMAITPLGREVLR